MTKLNFVCRKMKDPKKKSESRKNLDPAQVTYSKKGFLLFGSNIDLGKDAF
jgi:hypothetical protein